MLTQEESDNYRKAGQVSAEALEFGRKLIKPGARILEVADKVEKFIKDKGCGLAFPVNISFNSAAAHDTAFPNEQRVFKDEVVKLDLGAEIGGFLGDNAVTIDLSGQNSELVKASREALDNVIKMIRPGVQLREVGKTVEETIQSHGFEPVRNLSGHQLAQYSLHHGLSMPNYDSGDTTEIQAGMVFAIEPFATTEVGLITERGRAGIFSQIAKKPVRNPTTRKVLAEVEQYKGVPFASRWLTNKFQLFQLQVALRDLVTAGVLRPYPPLVEKRDGLVSQAEHTILVDEKVTVLTKQQ